MENFIVEKKENCYCSIKGDNFDEKKMLLNKLENCDYLLMDCIGQEINLKNVYIEKIVKEKKDKNNNYIYNENGELEYTTKYRTIIFDDEGKAYATGSYGIYNKLNNLVKVFGTPDVWNEPIKIKIVKLKNKDNHNILSFQIV